MILISENNEYRYYAVVVPKDAENINVIYFTDGQIWLLLGKAGWKNPEHIEIPENSKVLGVIGNEEDDNGYFGETSIPYLKKLCKEKGILIDNPIKEPLTEDHTIFAELHHDFKSKLVKAVIIKVKK